MIFSYYKNKFLINIGVILLFFIAAIVFIILPALAEISKVNEEITIERNKLERKLALGLNIKKIIKDLEAVDETVKYLDDILIEKNQELSFVNILETLSSQYGLKIEISSDFAKVDIGDNIAQVEVQAVVTGNYKQILKFLNEVEKQKNYFNLKIITLSKNKKAESSEIRAQLIGQTYFKKWKSQILKTWISSL